MVDPRVKCIVLYYKYTPDSKNPVEGYFGDNELAPLTPRQKEIVRLIGEGYSNLAIASKLSISIKTIHSYIHTILDEKIPVDPQKYDPRVVLALISQTKYVSSPP